MQYQLVIHGRWLTRSGKKTFQDRDDLMEYLKPIFAESYDEIEKLYRYDHDKILNCIRNSFTIFQISEHSKIKKAFKDCHVKRMKIIYKEVTPKCKKSQDGSTSPTKDQ